MAAPPRRAAQAIAERWHQLECWIAVAAFAFIAVILLLDVLGRELLGPLIRLLGFPATATGIFASQKLSIFALVIGSFAGIGIATATASHLVPRVGFGWVPARWDPWFNRLADLHHRPVSRRRRLLRLGLRCSRRWRPTCARRCSTGASGRSSWRSRSASCRPPAAIFMYAAWPAIRPQPPEFQE